MKKQQRIWINRTAWVLFVIYIAALVYFLFINDRTVGSEYRMNLEPFKEIRRFFTYRETVGNNHNIILDLLGKKIKIPLLFGTKSFMVNMFGNVLAFVPFGFVLPIISSKNRRFLNVLLLTLELTITIELFQLLLKVGIFDVDDILLNTVGGMIGYILFAICNKLLYGRKKRR